MNDDRRKHQVIPTDEDWGDCEGDFDLSDARRVFGGHSNEEMHRHFATNVMMRAQDLRFMPRQPFMYYIQGFIDFVLSGAYGDQDSNDVANCFLDIVRARASDDPSALTSIYDRIVTALEFVVKNQDLEYLDIYGNFRERADSIKRLIENLDLKGPGCSP